MRWKELVSKSLNIELLRYFEEGVCILYGGRNIRQSVPDVLGKAGVHMLKALFTVMGESLSFSIAEFMQMVHQVMRLGRLWLLVEGRLGG